MQLCNMTSESVSHWSEFIKMFYKMWWIMTFFSFFFAWRSHAGHTGPHSLVGCGFRLSSWNRSRCWSFPQRAWRWCYCDGLLWRIIKQCMYMHKPTIGQKDMHALARMHVYGHALTCMYIFKRLYRHVRFLYILSLRQAHTDRQTDTHTHICIHVHCWFNLMPRVWDYKYRKSNFPQERGSKLYPQQY